MQLQEPSEQQAVQLQEPSEQQAMQPQEPSEQQAAQPQELGEPQAVQPQEPSEPQAVQLPGAPAQPEIVCGVVATIDGEAVTLHDLRKFKADRGIFLPPDVREDYRKILDALIESRLLSVEFTKLNITATDSDVDIYINNVLEQGGSSREEVMAALDEAGLKWEDYFERMREEVQRLGLINMLIRSRVNVSPEEVEREWRSNPDYMEPPKVEISHIFLPFPVAGDEAGRAEVRALASEVYSRVKRRGFEDAAREYSRGPTASEGGYLGVFTRGTMAPHFEQAIAGLRDGDVAAPVEVVQGIHIVKLLRVMPSRRVALEKVREEIRARLYDERLDRRFRRWATEDLRKEHHITVELEKLALIITS